MSHAGGQEVQQKPAIPDSELIEGLKEDPNYFAVKYNEMQKEAADSELAAKAKEKMSDGRGLVGQTEVAPKAAVSGMFASRAGGVYVPPHKLRRMQEEMMKNAENSEEQKQRIKWEMLRKSINEIINKVNVANIQNVIIELLNENIMKGMGLVGRAIIKGQMASPNFTHVYAAVVSVINTKLPDIGHLIIRRVILQFRRAYQRNNKIVCGATTKFLAHLINQKVLSDLFGLELLIFLLEEPTEDSVDIACDFMKECGQVLTELTPGGVNAIFERFKGILHEGETDRKVQYSIENLFAIRKNKFRDYPGVIAELDLVDDEDQITHNTELDAEITGEEQLNIFRLDPFFDKTEEEWRQIRVSILGEDNVLKLKASAMQLEDDEDEGEPQPQIVDFTEDDMLKLRETIYLVIMNSIDFEECAHKLMKLNIGRGHEEVLSKMIIDCCVQERTYLKFYGLLAQRFCNIDDIYKKYFFRLFVDNYTVIHRFTTAKIRNLAKVFSHLLLTDALDWHVLRCVTLTDDATTASSRIFLKILFQDLAENMGLKTLCQRLHDPDMKDYFVGLFPTDHPQNARFAANFFGLIGLDAVSQPLKDSLASGMLADDTERLLMELATVTSSSDSSDSSSSDDSSDEEDQKKVVDRSKSIDKQKLANDGRQSRSKNGVPPTGKPPADIDRKKAEEEKKIKTREDGGRVGMAEEKLKSKERKSKPEKGEREKKQPLKRKERLRSSSSGAEEKATSKKKAVEVPKTVAKEEKAKPKELKKEEKAKPKDRSRSREKEKLKFKARRDSTESMKKRKVEEKKPKEEKPKTKPVPSPSKSSTSSSGSRSSSSSSSRAKPAETKIRHRRRNRSSSSNKSSRKPALRKTKESKSRSRTKEKAPILAKTEVKTDKLKMKRRRDSSSEVSKKSKPKKIEKDKPKKEEPAVASKKKAPKDTKEGDKLKSKRRRSSSSNSSSSSSLSSSTDSNSSSSN